MPLCTCLDFDSSKCTVAFTPCTVKPVAEHLSSLYYSVVRPKSPAPLPIYDMTRSNQSFKLI